MCIDPPLPPSDDLIALADRHLHADDNRFLADIEVAEAADQPHAVHLAGTLLEAADEEHPFVGLSFLIAGERGGFLRRRSDDARQGTAGNRHRRRLVGLPLSFGHTRSPLGASRF
jgi:hypothetical protein